MEIYNDEVAELKKYAYAKWSSYVDFLHKIAYEEGFGRTTIDRVLPPKNAAPDMLVKRMFIPSVKIIDTKIVMSLGEEVFMYDDLTNAKSFIDSHADRMFNVFANKMSRMKKRY